MLSPRYDPPQQHKLPLATSSMPESLGSNNIARQAHHERRWLELRRQPFNGSYLEGNIAEYRQKNYRTRQNRIPPWLHWPKSRTKPRRKLPKLNFSYVPPPTQTLSTTSVSALFGACFCPLGFHSESFVPSHSGPRHVRLTHRPTQKCGIL